MTAQRKAFEAWRNIRDNKPMYDFGFNIWQAACAWQRERDAEICDKISEMPRDPEYSAGAHYCGHAIRNQGDE